MLYSEKTRAKKAVFLDDYTSSLSRALLTEQNTEELLFVAAKEIHKPLFLEDIYGKLLCCASDMNTLPILERTLVDCYDKENQNTFYRKITTDAPEIKYVDLNTCGIYPICRGRKQIAVLSVLNCFEELNDLNKKYIAILCDYLSIKLSGTPSTGSSLSPGEHFLTQLLNGSITDEQIISLRAKLYGIEESSEHYLACIATNQQTETDIKDALCGAGVKNSVLHKQNIVFLLPRRLHDTICLPRFNNSFSRLLRYFGVYAGLSLSFRGFDALPQYYLQSQKAAELGIYCTDSEKNIFYYETYMVSDLLMEYSRNHNLSKLIHPAIKTLFEYDREYDTDYLRTLSLFLSESGSQQQIANKLHIHINTLVYRLNKITEITGCNINDQQVLFSLTLALKIFSLIDKDIN